jgi:hypothetical protein
MRNGLTGRPAWLITGLFFALLAAAPVSDCFAQSGSCDQEGYYYQSHGYVVRSVIVANPFSFLQAEKKNMAWLKAALPLQDGQPFSTSAYNQGPAIIEGKLKAEYPDLSQRFRVTVVTAKLESCDSTSSPPRLDVQYYVLATDYRAYTSHLFDVKKAEIAEPATTAAVENTASWLTVKPLAEYNATEHLAGGISTTATLPDGNASLGMNFQKSSSSTQGGVQLQGDITPDLTLVNRLDWRVTYSYFKLPTGSADIGEGKLTLQFLGSSKPFTHLGLVLRYGSSVEGGNEQTTMASPPVALPKQDLSNSGFAAVKSYIGVTARTSHQSFATSYGVEFGSASSNPNLDFVKHLFDFNYAGRLYGRQTGDEVFHRSLTLEAEVAGGVIQNLSGIPTPERFFGGNIAQSFMPGDTWTIPDGPIIRSIPQDQLNGSSSGFLGATSFYSINTTWSVPVWGRSIIPREVTAGGDFKNKLEFAEGTATSTLALYYQAKSAAVQSALAESEKLYNKLTSLDQELTTITKEQQSNAALVGQLTNAKADSGFLERSLKGAQAQKGATLSQVVGNGQFTPWSAVLSDLSSIKDSLNGQYPELATITQSLVSSQTLILSDLQAVDVQAAQKQANAEMATVRSVLNSLVDEVNLFSISPVAAFDVARIWPDKFGTRYGIGGGVRASIVNFNVTLGYSVNPNPHPGEGRGALFFSMNVIDLFR